MRIAVFGHDANHPDWQKRMSAFARLSHEAHGFMLRRGELATYPWPHTDLGESRDADFSQRVLAVGKGAWRAKMMGAANEVDLIWARNLDMLGIAVAAQQDESTPIIYETLDIHESLYDEGPKGKILRSIERNLLKKTAAILVSSPAFITAYYDRFHPDHPPITLVENRLAQDSLPSRPLPSTHVPTKRRAIRIGWVGMLRCARTLSILDHVAKEANGQVEVHLHGQPSEVELPDFATTLAANPSLKYLGPYAGVAALKGIYETLDAVWAGDYLHAQGNSLWLLPNRLYEGGYFGVPALIGSGREAASWIARHGTGILLEEPIEQSLLDLTQEEGLLTRLTQLKRDILSLPSDLFVGSDDDLANFLREVSCRSAH